MSLMGTDKNTIFPLRVRVLYNFGLIGKSFSREHLESGGAPTIFIDADDFRYDNMYDGPKVIKKGLSIEFREEEKDRIKEYFNNLVENSWDKMESFFGSYGVKLPEKEEVSESLSKSFIEYIEGIENFFYGIFDDYEKIEKMEKEAYMEFPMTPSEILQLAAEVTVPCAYSIKKDIYSNNPRVHIYFEDIEKTLRKYDEEKNPLKRLKSIDLTMKDLDYLEKGKDYKKSWELSDVLKDLAKAIFYGHGFQYLNTERIDEVVHLALSMGGRFYSLFPKVETIKGPGGEEEFLITANIVDRTANISGSEVPFPAILVSIETSAKGENGKEVKATHESEKETKEAGPLRVGFGFLIELSNTVLEKKYGKPFSENDIIEDVAHYTEPGEGSVKAAYYNSSYYVYLRTRVSFKSGAMWCPAAFSYIRLEEKVFEKGVLDKERVSKIRVPKVFLTSLVFDSPESKDLDLDSFINIYYKLLSEERELVLESLLPQDSLVTSVLSSYLGHVASKESVVIVPPFELYTEKSEKEGEENEEDEENYNEEEYDEESYDEENHNEKYSIEDLTIRSLTPIAVRKPIKREKGKDYRKKSDQDTLLSNLEFYNYFISNSEIIGDRLTLHPFTIAAIFEKYLAGGKSDLCFSQDGKIKVKITPKIWEDMEDEIKKRLPFKKVDEARSWEYRSKELSTHTKEETLRFYNEYHFYESDTYSVEKTKLAVNYEERVKEKIRRGLFYVLSWTTLADPKKVGDVEKIRKRLFGK